MPRLPPNTRVFLCTAPTDRRKSFNGLIAATQQLIRKDPLSGHLFVFANRKRDMAKVLYYERGGFCLWAKRLEQGRFAVVAGDEGVAPLSNTQLHMWLDGIELDRPQRKRFVLKNAA